MNKIDFAKNFYTKCNVINVQELIDLTDNWSFIFKHHLNSSCFPSCIANDTLFVSCNPGSMIDLLSFKNYIAYKVNIFFGKTVVKNVILQPKFM